MSVPSLIDPERHKLSIGSPTSLEGMEVDYSELVWFPCCNEIDPGDEQRDLMARVDGDHDSLVRR